MDLLINFIERCLRFAEDTSEIEFFRHQAFGAVMFYQELMNSQGVSYETLKAITDLWRTEYTERFDALWLKLKA